MKPGAEKQRGHSVVEVALIAPWILFLFVGVFDFGFYAYALISVENAARAAAMRTSASQAQSGNSITACQAALEELALMPNTRTLLSCTPPLTVTAQAVTGPDSQPATQVTVTYQTVGLIPIPGVINKQMTINRTVEMRVRQ